MLSNSVDITVQNINIEYKNLIQDQNTLKRVAHNTDGYYMDIESLDSMLVNIEISPIQKSKHYQLSGLSLQYYWWILIVLLGIEWFFRKKIGLL